jgi:hypothetical protein
MAITLGTESQLEAARIWRDRCLLNEGSVFSDAQLWTAAYLDELDRHFVENLDAGSGTFIERFQVQIAPASTGTKQLAGEMLWVMMLFPSNIGRDKKLKLISTVWEWSGHHLPIPREHPLLGEPLMKGVGGAGMAYNSFRADELVFFVVLMRDLRSRNRKEQEQLLSDPWKFAEWLDTIPGAQNRQFRHMLLHLLFPGEFERIASRDHKSTIDSTFASFLNGSGEKGTSFLARDRRLLQIRRALEQDYKAQTLDFYLPPLVQRWKVEDDPINTPPGVTGGEKGEDPPGVPPAYTEPPFTQILGNVREQGLRISSQTLRRYHLALKARGFVILSGLSGTGKTWLTEVYARAVGAQHLIVPVAPNWNTNEDLLGYVNPLDGEYHDTAFSRFLRESAAEYEKANTEKRTSRPFHLVLDEMNLARVEYYFARFLSAMEVRSRYGTATIELGPNEQIQLPPTLRFIGTVNVDETTHAFADKVYDRAQLIEMEAPRETLLEHLGQVPHRQALIDVWDAVQGVAPFAFRVVDEIGQYMKVADGLGASWEELLDEQILQKVLPKLKGADPRVGDALTALEEITAERYPLSNRKVLRMRQGFLQHGFASFF